MCRTSSLYARALVDLLVREFPAFRFRFDAQNNTIYIYRRGYDPSHTSTWLPPPVGSVKLLVRGYAVQRGSDPPTTYADADAAVAAVRDLDP